ncbi:MAG: ankyrin repeat domain-containing protein [Methylophilaceae bacterium]|jgi:ankyrin repeat protein|nr:ankyrin repeat domain-containing protein [Methylophilaceae bacterium]NCA26838.1 ankyrin repeat domain-containing protein [Methylophilaceae bacterium]
MKMIKALLMVIALSLPFASFAMEGEQQVEYTQGLRDGDLKIVKKYLDSGTDVNEKFFAWTAIQIATNNNQLAVVKLLVERGADINYVHPVTKMTALHLAAYDGHQEIVKYLISKGADLTLKLKGDVSILRLVHDKGDKKMEEILLAAGARDDGCKEDKCFY